MAFRIGQKVVCVRKVKFIPNDETGPEKGVVYTIRDIVDYGTWGVGLRLEEIVNKPKQYRNIGQGAGPHECSFCVTRFRPVKTTNIDVFLKMLEPTPETVS